MLAALFGAKAKKNAVSVTGSHARINPGDMPSSQLPCVWRVASGAAAGWKAKGRARGGNKWYSGMWGGCGLETSRARAVSDTGVLV